MILTINQWGNSQGIRIPKELLKRLHAKVGSTLNADFKNGKVVIEKIDQPKEYNIHDLVKQIKKDYINENIDWGKTEGNEIW